jgi:hypothetical protein
LINSPKNKLLIASQNNGPLEVYILNKWFRTYFLLILIKKLDT